MAAPLGGMTGLYGPVDQPHGTTGRDASNWGGPVDRRHAIPGESSHERPYGGTRYPREEDLAGEPGTGEAPPGFVLDRTPTVHSAPYPALPYGEQLDAQVAAEQMRQLHGLDLGGPAHEHYRGVQYPVTVDSARHDSPFESGLASPPGQLRSGKDLDQGYGQPNGYGFNLGRQFRRWFQDAVPRDRSTLNAGERPFYGRHPQWQARFDGDDSPYGGAGDTSIDMAMRATPVGSPSPYEQPPNPTVAAQSGYLESPVINEGWV
jgi:hypothetical protein